MIFCAGDQELLRYQRHGALEGVNQYDTLVAIQAQRRPVPAASGVSSTYNARVVGAALLLFSDDILMDGDTFGMTSPIY